MLFCFKLTPQKLEIRKDYPHKCLFVKYIIYIKYTCVMLCFLFWRFNGNIYYTLKIFTFFIQYARSFRHLVFICYMLWVFSSTKYSMFDLWHCVLQHYIVYYLLRCVFFSTISCITCYGVCFAALYRVLLVTLCVLQHYIVEPVSVLL